MYRALVLLALPALLVAAAPEPPDDWSPARAAEYLDARQQQWFAWPQAASPNGACVSCHTGMTYLLARPALRRTLGETEPTVYERGLLGRLRANVGAKPPSALQGVEVIFAAMFLSRTDQGAPAAETRKAFDQLWTLQLREGAAAGSWRWYAANLDPWEHTGSDFYGASLAALALGTAAMDLQRDANPAQVDALTAYLTGTRGQRPLHDRLALLWASSKRPSVLPGAARQALVAEVIGKQQADGGWTIESLGPWSSHPDAPAAAGSSSYATAFTVFVLEQSGLAPSDPAVARGVAWLKAHQDRETGAWPAASMNKRYPRGSMESLFMQDAATAFASLALINATP